MKFLHVLGLVASLALVTSPLTTAGAPAPLSDTYSGIIGIGGDAGDQGSISIKITSTGKYTLRGRAAGIGFSHKGEVPEGGAVSEDFTIKLLGGFIKIQTHLEFVVPVGSDKIEGTAKFTFGEDTATLNFTLYKAFPYTNESPTPFAGRHVIVLTPLDKLSNIPGRGVATVNVSPTGLVKVSGSLADGAKFNCGGRLSETGIFPILNVLYNRTGFIGGFAEFGALSELNVLDWAKVTSKGDPIFRGDLDVNIIPYTPPAAGLPAISFGNQNNSALFALSGGGLVSFNPVTIQVSDTNKITVQGENEDKLKLELNKKTGLISGTIKLEINDTVKSRAIKLVVDQGDGRAFGFFVSPEPSADARLGVFNE